jgi:hypothetical protein
MGSIDEQILRTVKEIVVKFIETGRISPTGFHDAFTEIYSTVEKTVTGPQKATEMPEESAGNPEK